MPRKPRLHYSGAVYHIMSRGNNGQNVFLIEEDYKRFIDILADVKKKRPFTLFGYCLMPNHFHLLVETNRDSASVIMQRLLTRYSLYFNWRHKRKGHAFQGRYKSILCEKDSYLKELVRYVHLNPVRAKVSQKPADWKWSGHRNYIAGSNTGVVETGMVLSMFNGTLDECRRKYAAFVRDGLRMDHRDDLYPEEKMPYLGSQEFILEMQNKHADLIEKRVPGSAQKKQLSMNIVLSQIAERTGVPLATLQSKSRTSMHVSARKYFIIEAVRLGYSAANVAYLLRCSEGYISRVLNGRK